MVYEGAIFQRHLLKQSGVKMNLSNKRVYIAQNFQSFEGVEVKLSHFSFDGFTLEDVHAGSILQPSIHPRYKGAVGTCMHG